MKYTDAKLENGIYVIETIHVNSRQTFKQAVTEEMKSMKESYQLKLLGRV